MSPTRRNLLLGGTALALVASVPVAFGGIESFLRRVLTNHFGSDVLEIEGIGDLVREYAAYAGDGDFIKRIGAELYFSWRVDRLHMIDQAQDLETLFLQTVLTRSNIIALYQGTEDRLQFTDMDPWQPTCGLFLSALADPAGGT